MSLSVFIVSFIPSTVRSTRKAGDRRRASRTDTHFSLSVCVFHKLCILLCKNIVENVKLLCNCTDLNVSIVAECYRIDGLGDKHGENCAEFFSPSQESSSPGAFYAPRKKVRKEGENLPSCQKIVLENIIAERTRL